MQIKMNRSVEEIFQEGRFMAMLVREGVRLDEFQLG
jgi:hypothetical protein